MAGDDEQRSDYRQLDRRVYDGDEGPGTESEHSGNLPSTTGSFENLRHMCITLLFLFQKTTSLLRTMGNSHNIVSVVIVLRMYRSKLLMTHGRYSESMILILQSFMTKMRRLVFVTGQFFPASRPVA